MPEKVHIVPLILEAIRDDLKLHMRDNVAEDNINRADIVKIGLLQDSKTNKNIQLGVTGGDHDNPEEQDGISSIDKLPDIGLKFPVREIGGGKIWMRRGVVKVECFYVREKLEEEEATRYAYAVLGRAMDIVDNVQVAGLVDDFGERALTIDAYSNTFFESGGPPKTFIFRGKIMWAVHTERP